MDELPAEFIAALAEPYHDPEAAALAHLLDNDPGEFQNKPDDIIDAVA